MMQKSHIVPFKRSSHAAKHSRFSQHSGLFSRSLAVWLHHSRLFILASRSAALSSLHSRLFILASRSKAVSSLHSRFLILASRSKSFSSLHSRFLILASRSAALSTLHSRLFILAYRSAAVCLLATLFMCSLHAQVPSYVPTNGLVGWWPFNGNANDESGNGNNGTVNGATLTTDRFGVANKAYSFNGVSNTMTINNSAAFNFSNGQAISFWMNISSLPVSNEAIIFSQQTSSSTSAIGFNVSVTAGGNLNYRIGNGSTTSFAGCVNNSVNLNQWYNVICQIQNGQISVFLNTQLTCTNNQPNAIVGSPNIPMLIGDDTWGAGANAPNYNGKLDDISIYNRALTQQEITSLYTSSVPPTITTTATPNLINCGQTATLTASSTSATQPCIKADLPANLQNGLVGYWPFCGNANDASGNNNNGTVNGATLTTDRFGNANSAYNFDGNDGITIPPSTNQFITTSYTISIWINASQNNNVFDGYEIIGDRDAVTWNYRYRFNFGILNSGFSQDTLLMQASYGGPTKEIKTSSPLTNTWYHYVFTYDGSNTIAGYRNGILLGTQSGVSFLTLGNRQINIGRCVSPAYPNGGAFYFGKLDDIAIYNRALTPTEIQQLYTLGNVSYAWSTGATTPSISVSPAQTTSYSCTATNSAGSTTSSVTVTVADTLTWTGAFDTDWHKACNWSPEFVPRCCNPVKIPLTTNQPIVSGVAAAKDITIQTTNGALLTVNNGANLQIQDCPTTSTTNACPSLAVLTTTAASSITQTTAVSGGTITYQGSSAVTARGVCWSTTPNPTLANSFTSNGSGIGTFTSNLTGLVAGTTYYVRAYATNSSGTSYGNQVSFVAVNPQPAYPTNSVFCTGMPTLVVDVTNPSTGKTWMDRNLGATQVATSSTDAAAYGDLYQWGRGSDGHQCRNSATTTTLSATDQPGNALFIISPVVPNDWRVTQNNSLWQGVNGTNNPCPTGYRLPTDVEMENERLSWSVNTSVGAFNSPLKITMTGYRQESIVYSEGTVGNYWNTGISGTSIRNLNFSATGAGLSLAFRSYGMTVRCIKN